MNAANIYTLVQFHTDVLTPVSNDLVSQYYQSIYNHPYYVKPDFAWELPLWAAEISHNLRDYEHNFEVLRGAKSVNSAYIFGSVMDTNKALFLELVKMNPNSTFILGGYIESGFFADCDNVFYMSSVKAAMSFLDLPYSSGVNWELFQGIETIPRLTMSNGCAHKCKFCTIPNAVTQLGVNNIVEQILSFEPLKFNLIYLNDKTFGQSSNYRLLKDLYHLVKLYNPDFKGFVVQTTASAAIRINWSDLHIYAAEIGVESYNDEILKGLKKPANCNMIDEAANILSSHGIRFIPNIVIGFTDETKATYKNTIAYLKRTNLMHVNLYNLAVYNNTELSTEIDSNGVNDANEMICKKSYNSYYQNRLNKTALNSIAKYLLTLNS